MPGDYLPPGVYLPGQRHRILDCDTRRLRKPANLQHRFHRDQKRDPARCTGGSRRGRYPDRITFLLGGIEQAQGVGMACEEHIAVKVRVGIFPARPLEFLGKTEMGKAV